jgi:hypothetical protein
LTILSSIFPQSPSISHHDHRSQPLPLHDRRTADARRHFTTPASSLMATQSVVA